MSEAYQVSIRPTDTGYLIQLTGRGTLRVSPAVRDFVSGAMSDGAKIVLDLSQCEYLDSTFLGCLVLLHRQGQDDHAFTVLADASARKRLLEGMRLHQLLEFTEECPPSTGDDVTLTAADLERKEFCQHLIETHEKLAELGGPRAETFRRIARQLCDELESN